MQSRILLAIWFATVSLAGTSLYGQQEVDPTWYNPWPDSRGVVSRSIAPQASTAQIYANVGEGQSAFQAVSHQEGGKLARRFNPLQSGRSRHAKTPNRTVSSGRELSAIAPRRRATVSGGSGS